MIALLLILFLLVASCVVIHGTGMILGMQYIGRWWPQRHDHDHRMRMYGILTGVVFGLLLLHLLQIGVWAGFFQIAGFFPDFQTAFYYSATSYSTVGYGDVIPPERWRVFGAIEAVTGVLMFGWSTGALFAIVHRLQSQLMQRPGEGRREES